MQSEKDKADSEEEHLLKADQYATIQQKVRYEEKDMPRNISKARCVVVYFIKDNILSLLSFCENHNLFAKMKLVSLRKHFQNMKRNCD